MFKNLTKLELSILIGNALDHFDTSLYGFLAPILAPIFFPKYNPIVQLILAYSIVVTSLFTRPLAVFIFGNYTQNYGPVLALSYSLIGVAIASFAIGCIPGYTHIGWLAPLILILLRMIRSFFAAGECTIAKLYIMEGKEREDALKASQLYQGSAMCGIILASGAATAVSTFIEIDILWRVCFWIGGLTGISGYILRQYCTSNNKKDKKNSTSYSLSSLKSIWKYKIKVSYVAITTVFSYITYTIPFIFMNSFIPLISDISLHTMLALNTFLLIIDILLIIIIGPLLVKFNSKKIMLISSLTLACTIVPLLQGLNHASILYITFVRFWIVVLGVIFVCPLNYWYKKILNVPENYLLIGMGNALGAATLGRLNTVICLWLWHTTGTIFCFAFYIMVIALFTAYIINVVKIDEELN